MFQAALLQATRAAAKSRWLSRPASPLRTYRYRHPNLRRASPSPLEEAAGAYRSLVRTYTTAVGVGGIIGTAVVAYSVYANYQAFVAKVKAVRQSVLDRVASTRASVSDKATSMRTSVASQVDSARGSASEKVESVTDRIGSLRLAIQAKGSSHATKASAGTERENREPESADKPEFEAVSGKEEGGSHDVEHQASGRGSTALWRARLRKTSQASKDDCDGGDSS